MKITEVHIKNFRGLQDIKIDLSDRCNVIVGPNAIGKTSILEAIRLTKAVLAPRFTQETQQVLIALGALSPNFQAIGGNQLDFSSICGNPNEPTSINMLFILSGSELDLLQNNSGQLAMGIVRSNFGRNDESGQFALTQFLSTPNGQSTLTQALTSVSEYLAKLHHKPAVSLNLTINSVTGALSGSDIIGQIAIATIEQAQTVAKTVFNYFPADRAFPQGEVPVQLGSADGGAQIQSYIGAPATKYQRLKQVLVQGFILNPAGPAWLDSEFNEIFQTLIPGKQFDSISIGHHGQLKIIIRDTKTSKRFDIDSMSSGEKGIILTFLLIRQSITNGGILLIDEPELHLNPAVCQKLLPYLIAQCTANDAQAIVCSHSGEILATAYERDDCGLFHIRSGTDISKIHTEDLFEATEALKRLGISTDDVLFYKGNLFVEGPHDVEILKEGFYDTITGFKISYLNGRKELEKTIPNLVSADSKGKLNKLNVFVFDNDNNSVEYQNTSNVKTLQWQRYCLENFLLDEEILFDLIKLHASSPPASRGEFKSDMKGLAFSQLQDLAIRQVYVSKNFESPGLRTGEVDGKDINIVAKSISERLSAIGEQLRDFKAEKWSSNFIEEVQTEQSRLDNDWSGSWLEKCDGKKLINSLYRKYTINLSQIVFKKHVMQQMKNKKTESWKIIDELLIKVLRE